MADFIVDPQAEDLDPHGAETIAIAQPFLNAAMQLMPKLGVGQVLGALLTAYVNASGFSGNLDEAERLLGLALESLPRVRKEFAGEQLAASMPAGRA